LFSSFSRVFFSQFAHFLQGGEKKNHVQTTLYFHKTMKDGGWTSKSAVEEIVELENRIAQFQLVHGDEHQEKEVHLTMTHDHMNWDEPRDS